MDPRIGKVERRGRKTRMGLRPFFETSLSSPFQAILHEWIRELPQIRAENKITWTHSYDARGSDDTSPHAVG